MISAVDEFPAAFAILVLMRPHRQILNAATTLVAATFLASAAPASDGAQLDPLFEALKNAEPGGAREIEGRIWAEWSKSGSAAMDLLLERGREALEAGETTEAIEHFTALVDHAPGFAEGWNARATAYFQAGLYGPALEDIRRAVALNPRHFAAMSGLALILEEIGERKGALEAWRGVAAIHPQRQGVREAIERLEKAVEGVSL
jgi:tetratricopeptide (TPR) repeat protein